MKKILSKLSLPIFQFLFIIGVSLFLPQLDLVAFAAPTAAQTALSSTEYLTELVTFLSTGLQLVQQLLWPILLLIGPLLDNNLIFGPGIEDRLFEIWSQMRNITSLILAIMLVGVALANIFGVSDGSSYEIKSFLKKMVITLVVINFTFFGARIILDASNVLTNFAFGLPNTVQTQSISSLQNIEKGLCSALKQVGASAESNVFEGMLNLGLANEGSQGMCDQNSLTPAAKGFFSRISSSNLSMIMAANYSTIADGLEPSKTFQVTLDIVNLSINTALSLIMVLLHALAYISLFFILVVRLMFLWLSIALSPLIVFATIMGLSQFDELKGLYDEFFTHVFAPVKVGFALSISYIIFSTIEQTGISTPGMVLGQGLSYPFSGVGTLEKLIISLSSAIIVFEVALSVGSKTRASFITDSISQFAKTNARKGQSFLKRIPLGYAGKGSSPISISSLSKNWNDLVNATDTATGGTPTTTKPEVQKAIEAMTRTRGDATLAELTNFIKHREDPAVLASGLTVDQILRKIGTLRPASGTKEFRYKQALQNWKRSNSANSSRPGSLQNSNRDRDISVL